MKNNRALEVERTESIHGTRRVEEVVEVITNTVSAFLAVLMPLVLGHHHRIVLQWRLLMLMMVSAIVLLLLLLELHQLLLQLPLELTGQQRPIGADESGLHHGVRGCLAETCHLLSEIDLLSVRWQGRDRRRCGGGERGVGQLATLRRHGSAAKGGEVALHELLLLLPSSLALPVLHACVLHQVWRRLHWPQLNLGQVLEKDKIENESQHLRR